MLVIWQLCLRFHRQSVHFWRKFARWRRRRRVWTERDKISSQFWRGMDGYPKKNSSDGTPNQFMQPEYCDYRDSLKGFTCLRELSYCSSSTDLPGLAKHLSILVYFQFTNSSTDMVFKMCYAVWTVRLRKRFCSHFSESSADLLLGQYCNSP